MYTIIYLGKANLKDQKGGTVMLNTQTAANTFLMLGYQDGIFITPMKLQKLVYLLYKRYLQLTDARLFDEKFQKWQYGPVLPSLYYEFKSFGASPITKFARDAKGDVEMIDLKTTSVAKNAVLMVWEKYKNYSAIQLSMFTHCDGGAWSKADLGELRDEDIKNEPEFV